MDDRRLVLTIARSYGSGGLTMAKKLGAKLGIPVYDKEILRMASDESGVNEELFGRMDERVKKIFLSTRGRYKGAALPPSDSGFTSDDNLFELQAEVIKHIADEQNCIFVGRCADYILRDRDYVISLYMYAGEEDCLTRLRALSSESDTVLADRMHDIDKRRAEYYRYYTGHKWDDARNYDLCVNTGAMDYDRLIKAVEAYIDIRTAG